LASLGANHLYLEVASWAGVAHVLPARLPWLVGILEPLDPSQLACLQGLACQLAQVRGMLQGLAPRSDWLGRHSLRHLALQPGSAMYVH